MPTSLVQHVLERMLADDEDQSGRQQETYERASPAQKQAIDEAFICLCGYSLATILAGDT